LYLKKFDCTEDAVLISVSSALKVKGKNKKKKTSEEVEFNKFFSLMFNWSLINIELIDQDEKNKKNVNNEFNSDDEVVLKADSMMNIYEANTNVNEMKSRDSNAEWSIDDHSYINHRLIFEWRLVNELSERSEQQYCS